MLFKGGHFKKWDTGAYQNIYLKCSNPINEPKWKKKSKRIFSVFLEGFHDTLRNIKIWVFSKWMRKKKCNISINMET